MSLVSQKDHGELDARLAPAQPPLDLKKLPSWLVVDHQQRARRALGDREQGVRHGHRVLPQPDQLRAVKVVAAATQRQLSGEPPF